MEYSDEFLLFNCTNEEYHLGKCRFHDESFLDNASDTEIESLEQTVHEMLVGFYVENEPLVAMDYRLPRIEATGGISREINFVSAVFTDADFEKATFKRKARFTGATFESADFSGAIFKSNADFFQATFVKGNFSGVVFKDANFHGARFKGKVDFSGATFEGKADFAEATFEGQANFNGATFKGKADFTEASFLDIAVLQATFSEAYFYNAKFERAFFSSAKFVKVSFACATFDGQAQFSKAEIAGDADFTEAIFRGETNFNETTFEQEVDFHLTTFERKSKFIAARFNQTNFSWALFSSEAYFTRTTFKSRSDFNEVTFKSNVNFYSASFVNGAEFNGAIFLDAANLEAAFLRMTFFRKVTFAKLERVDFNGDLSSVSFLGTDITKVRFGDKTQWQQMIHMNGEKLSNGRVGQKIFDERELELNTVDVTFTLEALVAQYRNLRENYEFYLRYEEAGEFFVREREIIRNYERDSKAPGKIKKRGFIKRTFSLSGIYYHLTKYGESYSRPALIVFSIFTIAVLLFWYDVSKQSSAPSASFPWQSLGNAIARTLRSFLPFFNFPEDAGLSDYALRVTMIPLVGALFISLRRKFERRFRH